MAKPSHAPNVAFAMVLVMCAAPSALAQQGATRLEEVVVTARKRDERLQDVPVAVTALTRSTIERAAIAELDDVANLTPGLNFQNLIGEFLPTPIIRGVSQTQISGENNTAIFVDGVFLAGREGLNFSQLDIERIEVVKGPQSALYGRNSFSGAINVVTARPTDELEGSATLTVGNDGRLAGRAWISGPLLEDRLSGRLAIGSDQFDGSYDNANPGGGPDIGGYDYTTVSGSLRFTPTDEFELRLSGYLSDDEIGSPATSSLPANCEDNGTGLRPQEFCGTVPAIDDDDIAVVPRAVGEDREIRRLTLHVDWLTPVGELTAIAGYSRLTQSAFTDGSRNGGDFSTPFVYATTAGTLSSFRTGLLQENFEEETQDLSTELRLTTEFSDTFRGSIGGFYFDVEDTNADTGLIASEPLPGDFAGFCPCLPVAPGFTLAFGTNTFLPWFATDANGNVVGSGAADEFVFRDSEALAIFGYLEKDFGRFTARIEGRYSEEDRAFFDRGAMEGAEEKFDFFTSRLSLDYDVDDNLMIYGSAAKGVKAGGFDTGNAAGTLFVVRAFDEEENWTYEIGGKGNFLDGRLLADLSVYYIDWDDIVLPQVVVVNNIPVGLDDNAGTATVKGIELQASALLGEGLTTTLGLSYTDSEFDNATSDSFDSFPSFAPDGDISGNKLNRTPSVQANLSVQYERQLSGPWSWYARGDVSYQNRQYVEQDNLGKLPSRTLGNLRFGVESERYDLQLWVENVTDEDAPASAFRDVFFSNTVDGVTSPPNFATFFPFRLTVSHPRRRTFGLTATARF